MKNYPHRNKIVEQFKNYKNIQKHMVKITNRNLTTQTGITILH